MGVAVELLPVTGQTLPFISAGGTSIITTCISIGIIIGVTKKDEEVALDEEERVQREEALKRIIDKELNLDETEDSLLNGENPLQSVMNK